MPRSKRRVAGSLPLLMLLALAVPDGAAAQQDAPPVIANAKVVPASLAYQGGTVTISADVTDDTGVASVYGTVIAPDGSSGFVRLLPTGVTTYSAAYVIPANYTDFSVGHAVSVQATDLGGAVESAEAGDVQVDAQPQFDELPEVWDPSVSPRALPSAGGPVTVQASAFDTRSISEVYAVATPAGGGAPIHVPLEGIGSSRYEGTFTAPPNAGSTAVQYALAVTALDDIGQSASADAGLVTVAAAAAPAPALGRLVATPGSRSFGRVAVGAAARRSFLVRHVGPRRGGAIEGTIGEPGAPFAVVSGGGAFRLLPGQARTVVVELRPAAAGSFRDAVRVVRGDGRQRPLAVRLSGGGR